MIYPEQFEEKLGFDTIRQKLKGYCLSDPGKAWVDRIRFCTRKSEISVLLHQNFEFQSLLQRGETLPDQHFHDPTHWLATIALEGSYLEGTDMLQIARALEVIDIYKRILSAHAETSPHLYRLSEPVARTTEIARKILSVVDDAAAVKDNASVDLARIRRRLREEQSRLRRLTDQMFRHAVEQRWVPEGALPTVRDGRLVIPILAEHKRKLKGFIHDESATGQTVFMEPAEMLDTNNEIRELEHEERREVIRVLKLLTAELRAQLRDLENAFRFQSLIDFIRAKARLSMALGSEMPVLHDEPCLSWFQARHPILFLTLQGKRPIVPLDIELQTDTRMLLVSGPNAGGKSVCLKTVGLLQYMIQCGLMAPMSSRSQVGIFESILLDIGDQQSIENDLSTYSSHLKNMKFFVQHATERSLVLLDEMGSGTDPNFGGAIAEVILQSLVEKKVWGVATTHYYNLKLFAGRHPGIVNGAMLFDESRLSPQYVLSIGKPGSSFALEIARSTGLSGALIREAEARVGQELAGFEKMIRGLEKERAELTRRVRDLETRERELQMLLSKYDKLSTDLESKKKEIISKARADAEELLRSTNREIEKTIRHIRENQAEKKETRKVRKGLQELTTRIKKPEEVNVETEVVPLLVGDRVSIIGQDTVGIIQSLKGKNATVQFGDLKSLVPVIRLRRATRAEAKEVERRSAAGVNFNEKRSAFTSTLDIRGKRVDEVVAELDPFMDTAILLGVAELRIVHGKGEGVLRKVVRDHLKRYPQVASVSDEHADRGGEGVTIVVLK